MPSSPVAARAWGASWRGSSLLKDAMSAMCDVSVEAMAETKRLCEVEKLPQGLRITTHVADVSIEDHYKRFRDELIEQQATDKIHLLFNNAGIGGGGSLFTNTREQWERTFNICWGGVYLGVRTFLPLLVKADEAHIVNTSSVNGFWASVGMGVSHTAYSAAKFAVKGFTEAMVNDLRLNAPHVKCSVVMPGHIGTSIVSNSRKVQNGADQLNPDELKQARQRLQGQGIDVAKMSDADIQQLALDRARIFHDEAPTSAAAAAKIILDGVKADRWRILVGDDAHLLDERVRKTPEQAYTSEFYQGIVAATGWKVG
ncbi:NAD(P)-dependent dehydrogenase (short-subunit alcohol dehydrogenase family) [Bradyrhizobium sp. JR6.1]